jgi:hypothetical protein
MDIHINRITIYIKAFQTLAKMKSLQGGNTNIQIPALTTEYTAQ